MLIVELNDAKLINHSHIDAFLIGVKGFSSECYHHFDLDEVLSLIQAIKTSQRKVFIDLTSMYHDEDVCALTQLIDTLKEVDGFLYHDFLVHSLIPQEKRVYYAPTYMTDMNDFTLMCDECAYVLASPEMGLESLKRASSVKTWFLAFGTWEIFHSRRPLITNYFQYRGSNNCARSFYIKEEFRPNEAYPIIEERGTKIYLNDYYYLGKELDMLTGHFLNKTFNLSIELSNQIIDLYYEALNKKDASKLEEGLQKLAIHLHQGFLYQKAVLRKGDVSDD